jgi:alkylation response protein AidB-like acyl-CoA dehydrogenase
VDFSYSEDQASFRAEIRGWLASHVPTRPLASFDASRQGFEEHRQWERTLAAGNWSAVTWPTMYGGRGLDLIQWLIFEEEYSRAAAPGRVNQNGIFLLGPTLIEFGTASQKQRFLTAMASGDEIWAQAWSEPQAGSDLAAVRASARRDDDEYVLNGQKIWSSRAAFADWAFGLFRSDASGERYAGLSVILFPLTAPGITVRPIRRIDGKIGFAEIFLDNVRVPIGNRLGDEGKGWNICMATAGFERGLMLRSPARYQLAAAKLIDLYRRHASETTPSVKSAVIRAWMDAESYALSIYATANRLMAGGSIGAEASTNKIFWSELDIALHETALAILGPRAELLPEAPDAGDVSTWLGDYIFSLSGPIYAGTNEIQRNIIAERMLGLPR